MERLSLVPTLPPSAQPAHSHCEDHLTSRQPPYRHSEQLLYCMNRDCQKLCLDGVTQTLQPQVPQSVHLQHGSSSLLGCSGSQAKMNLKLYSQNHFSATMENGTEKLRKVIASYLPECTPHYESFCQLHEICSQKIETKNNTKDF